MILNEELEKEFIKNIKFIEDCIKSGGCKGQSCLECPLSTKGKYVKSCFFYEFSHFNKLKLSPAVTGNGLLNEELSDILKIFIKKYKLKKILNQGKNNE
jgi:hypothetical protein